ncbi:phosphohydrolase [Anoxybacter fermentans]|uniref:Phosphohydrolase n=1 Tax=Anoxybacter fermentans TaxID=1323375 RepID=A0A3S9SVG0_9FIRM|nr:HD-GYP domain-containing protein [Anoxybacter fermentans]AZR72264.1 phosphohydrolase [Anoxybacter fermentans]
MVSGTYLISCVDFHEFVESLAKALDTKDHYTYGHSERVSQLVERIALEMGMKEEQMFMAHIAAHLHDIGKIGIPDSILNKPGRLTEDEFKIVQQHPLKGFEILNKVKSFRKIAEIVKYHHERYDGKGYPDGLKGERIPLEARIIAVADAFDAMTSYRPYRKKMKISEAIQELKEHIYDQFDPEVVEVIENIYREDQSFLEELVVSGTEDYHYLEVKHENIYHSRKS